MSVDGAGALVGAVAGVGESGGGVGVDDAVHVVGGIHDAGALAAGGDAGVVGGGVGREF